MNGAEHFPPRSRLLITGVEGVLGANLALALADRATVLGLCGKGAAHLQGPTTDAWDPRNTRQATALIQRFAPDAILHCGQLGRGSWDISEETFEGEHEALVCRLLARAAAETGARLVVFSTDAVLAGPRMFHQEGSASAARHWARTVRQIERSATEAGALVVRTHPYGWPPPRATPGFAQCAWQALREGAAMRFDPRRFATPILATDLADLAFLALRKRLSGVWHVAGAERVSQYRFAQELAAALGMRDCPIAAGEEPPDPPSETAETSLDSRRASRALGRSMPALREGLTRFVEQATSGFRNRLRGQLLADAA